MPNSFLSQEVEQTFAPTAPSETDSSDAQALYEFGVRLTELESDNLQSVDLSVLAELPDVFSSNSTPKALALWCFAQCLQRYPKHQEAAMAMANMIVANPLSLNLNGENPTQKKPETVHVGKVSPSYTDELVLLQLYRLITREPQNSEAINNCIRKITDSKTTAIVRYLMAIHGQFQKGKDVVAPETLQALLNYADNENNPYRAVVYTLYADLRRVEFDTHNDKAIAKIKYAISRAFQLNANLSDTWFVVAFAMSSDIDIRDIDLPKEFPFEVDTSLQLIHCLNRAIELDETHAAAWNDLGVAVDNYEIDLTTLDDTPKGIPPSASLALQEAYCYAQALRINPSFSNAFENLGLCLIENVISLDALGDLPPGFPKHENSATQAAWCYLQAIKYTPEKDKIWINLGDALSSGHVNLSQLKSLPKEFPWQENASIQALWCSERCLQRNSNIQADVNTCSELLRSMPLFSNALAVTQRCMPILNETQLDAIFAEEPVDVSVLGELAEVFSQNTDPEILEFWCYSNALLSDPENAVLAKKVANIILMNPTLMKLISEFAKPSTLLANLNADHNNVLTWYALGNHFMCHNVDLSMLNGKLPVGFPTEKSHLKQAEWCFQQCLNVLSQHEPDTPESQLCINGMAIAVRKHHMTFELGSEVPCFSPIVKAMADTKHPMRPEASDSLFDSSSKNSGEPDVTRDDSKLNVVFDMSPSK